MRDRERSGTYLAVCGTTEEPDMGLALLQQGLAVAARGTVKGTSFESIYALTE
ncbi:MAG: hypothetical protein EBZ69_08440, partial [Alphaproteobacteria bacterium]|nr:hypothetical protein [Alphaproteobacteria bacterium]